MGKLTSCRPARAAASRGVRPPGWAAGAVLAALAAALLAGSAGRGDPPPRAGLGQMLVAAQWPASNLDDPRPRLVLLRPDGSTRVLSDGFFAACDPDVSFDGARLLFAGQKAAGDPWQIYEMAAHGTGVRQVLRQAGDCRTPRYQGKLFVLDSPRPWYQVTFVGNHDGRRADGDSSPSAHLYSCKPDGSALAQITHTLGRDLDPCLLPDGRLLFSGESRLKRQPGLYAVNLDGTDYALYAPAPAALTPRMPAVTTRGLVVFVEPSPAARDGAGKLGSVTLRRPLHSYRAVTRWADGLFAWPSPLPDGRVLVSRREGQGTHAVGRLDPASGTFESLFHDPAWHTVQAKVLGPHPEPDGRSSNVLPEDPHGKLYGLNVGENDLKGAKSLPAGTVKKLRVLEGVPAGPKGGGTVARLLGEVPIGADGSFNVEVPANVPVRLQTVDADGLAVRTCAWIWARNHESRGCIGCHEDGERVPDNRFAESLAEASVVLCPPPGERRTVDFRHDVLPIVRAKCAACHGKPDVPPALPAAGQDGEAAARRTYDLLLSRYVHPGRARTSPLVWHLFGRNTSRAHDGDVGKTPVKAIPPGGPALTEAERRTVMEWIDAGAVWDAGSPGTRR